MIQVIPARVDSPGYFQAFYPAPPSGQCLARSSTGPGSNPGGYQPEPFIHTVAHFGAFGVLPMLIASALYWNALQPVPRELQTPRSRPSGPDKISAETLKPIYFI